MPLPDKFPPQLQIDAEGLQDGKIEGVHPPDAAQARKTRDGSWIQKNETAYYRRGEFWGRLESGQWTWLQKSQGRWWLWSAPGKPPDLWNRGHWWVQNDGNWFLFHNGQAWGYQYLKQWGQQGFRNQAGEQIVYSGDGRRVLISAPRQGAALFDAQTGARLGEWDPEIAPRRPPPHIPSPSSVLFD
ncbi:MAG: hypothetical protein KGL04_08535 [Elusimicrobia bacterium]|nr:hypothetical protein [Elusimicrobiota bacterium]